MNEELVRSLKREPVRYANLIGFDLLTDLHNEWIRRMVFSKDDRTLLGHRGSYKTTCLSFAISQIMVLYPDESIIFLRKTDDDVIEVIRQVANILQTDVFAYIIREIYGIELNISASAFKIDTNLFQSVSGSTQLLGIGIGASLTGKHADVVFTDDIVNIRDRTSRAERERIKLQYMELQNIKNRNGRIFNTGTPWHKEDAISLMPNVERHDCYSTGLIEREKLKELRAGMSDSLFAANYELKHIADADAMFKEPRYTGNEEAIYGGRAHIDAAYGGEDGTAYTIFNELPDGTIIGFGKLWQKHVDDCLAEIKIYHDRYQAGSIACEKNADKGYLAKELKALGFFVRGYQEKTNKFVKISSYLRKNWRRIQWLDDTDPEYISQILDYTEHAAHDDAPDSAASLLRAITKQESATIQTFKGGI